MLPLQMVSYLAKLQGWPQKLILPGLLLDFKYNKDLLIQLLSPNFGVIYKELSKVQT